MPDSSLSEPSPKAFVCQMPKKIPGLILELWSSRNATCLSLRRALTAVAIIVFSVDSGCLAWVRTSCEKRADGRENIGASARINVPGEIAVFAIIPYPFCSMTVR